MPNQPLAERMRPQNLSEFIGQEQLVGNNRPIRQMIDNNQLRSLIFWGPPGVGKTTLARIIAQESNQQFFGLNAIDAGVKEVRQIIATAKKLGTAILFIDEIHRFNKAQQDALLAAVEAGIITLIGATTENPSFEVIAPLLSRCQVYVLEPLSYEHLRAIADQAIAKDTVLSQKDMHIVEDDLLIQYSGGDARKLYNLLELLADLNKQPISITNDLVQQQLQQNMARYDKNGEQHYDIISAFIKSIRGSDPNAAVYYLARMIEGGEDPKFIARRLLIAASEDIGNANPNALLLANACFDGVEKIGYPECRILLSQTAIYLANSPKSNSTYEAINRAQAIVKKTGDLPVPLSIRNAPTQLMNDLGYGKDYQYAHAYENNFVNQEFLPDKLSGLKLYDPGKNASEQKQAERLRSLWKEKYGY